MDPDSSLILFRSLPEAHRFALAEKRLLNNFARQLQQQVADGQRFGCLITNDLELRKLNHSFLRHDYITDVLSFPAPGTGELGDLAISAERAHAQAMAFGHSRMDEVRVLMLHGVLHLIGFDHERDRGKMARAEQKWRAEFGLPTTLIARSAASEAVR